MAESHPKAAHAKPEPDLSGRRLGDYHLVRRLGRGGMAEVYLAEQGSLHRQVAFKVLRAALAGDETYVRRFHNEAQAAASLVHANIVQIHEVGCIDGVHFIAQEYVAGQNLRQLLGRKGAMDVRLAVNITRQVAAALHKAAARGITHRDIKPENILLSPTGEVKVADFGLARVTDSAGKVDLTQVGVTLGTPLYMSPEQVEGQAVDPRSDLYSLGITCYQMLAGRPPFQGETALSLAVQQLNSRPRPLSEVRRDLPPALVRIVHKMLAKKPGERYQSAAELLGDLRALQIEGLEEGWPTDIDKWTRSEMLAMADARTAATQQLQTVMQSAARRRRGRRKLWWLAAGMLVAFALGAGLAAALQPTSLLDVPAGHRPPIERRATVVDQYNHAKQLWNERAFLSVLEYFPPEQGTQNELYGYRAKLQLAYIYESDRPDAAARYYAELAGQDLDWQLKAFGLIGQANGFSRQGDRPQAVQRVQGLVNVLAGRTQVPPRDRQQWVTNWSQLLDPPLRQDFLTLLRERLPGGPNGRGPRRPGDAGPRD